MKKKYIYPSIEVDSYEIEECLKVSANGIGYGGVDENGEHEAESRSSRFQSWGDDSE